MNTDTNNPSRNSTGAENASMAAAPGERPATTPTGGPVQKMDGTNPYADEDSVIDDEIARETIEKK